jgi:hypothetical protein
MTPKELLTEAYKRQEVLIGYLPHWSDNRQHMIIRDWLKTEAKNPFWDFSHRQSEEALESDPCIRMARLILGTVDGSEL